MAAVGVTQCSFFLPGRAPPPSASLGRRSLPAQATESTANESSGTLLDVRFSTGTFVPQNFTLSSPGQSATFNFGTINFAEGRTLLAGSWPVNGWAQHHHPNYLCRPERSDTDRPGGRDGYGRVRSADSGVDYCD